MRNPSPRPRLRQHPDDLSGGRGPSRPSYPPRTYARIGQAADPARVGEVLDRALRSLGTPSVTGVEVIFERWDDVVGAAMASRTRPVRIDGDVLVVGCDEPAVATHVRFLQAQLVERLGQLSGERRIGRIEVRVTQGRPTSRPRPPRAAARRPARPSAGRTAARR